MKTLRHRPRPDDVYQNPPPTPPTDDVQESKSPESGLQKSAGGKPFTKDDAEALIRVGEDIMNVLPENVEDSWSNWVKIQEVRDHLYKTRLYN